MQEAVMTANAAAGRPRYRSGERPSFRGEALAPFELARLLASPVYYGVGVPRGDRSPVLVIPGYMGSDSYLTVLRRWLRRIGYRAERSEVGRMSGPPAELASHFSKRIDEVSVDTGRKVKIIGHSLGGVVARVMAVTKPEKVDQVITMASPLRMFGRFPTVSIEAPVSAQEEAAWDSRRLFERLAQPLPAGVSLSAIYSKDDPIVGWRGATDSDPRATSHEVSGTHIGMAWNADVYRLLGKLLAQERQRPFASSPEPAGEVTFV
jgi:pimeloyl-ACP methyl ester carboxylesterase